MEEEKNEIKALRLDQISDFEEYDQILSLAEDVNDKINSIRRDIEVLRTTTIILLGFLCIGYYFFYRFLLWKYDSVIYDTISPVLAIILVILLLVYYFIKFRKLEKRYKRERHVATRLFNIISSYKDEVEFNMRVLQKAVNEMRVSRLEFEFKDKSPFVFSFIESFFETVTRVFFRIR